MRIILKLLSSVKTSYMPAFITLVAVLCAVFFKDTELDPLPVANICFFALACLNFLFLSLITDMRSVFFSLLIFCIYICGRRLLTNDSYMLETSGIYTWLMLCGALNLFAFFHISSKSKYAFLILIAFLFEGAFLENLYLSGFSSLPMGFSNLSFVLFGLVFMYLLSSVSIEPSIKSNAFFFASLLVFLALLNIEDTYLFVFSLLGAMLITLLSNVFSALYTYFRDPVTGLYSLNSFQRHELKFFPPKYTVAFFYIDNYQKLLNVFKQKQTDLLVKMVIKRALSLDLTPYIYRLRADQFCLIFFDTDVKQTYELIENMRRLIAGTEFVLLNKKALKLTITPAVSEKRRSDADAFAVLSRMYENFRQRYTFTQNMTFCEEIEKNKKVNKASFRR